ncbi:MAG: T9SS type A sorting domain-containing protein [Bacteroidales bacterium]|jgi:hypothetical protein
MKRINQYLLLAVFLFTTSVLHAQLNVQATRWAVPGMQIDFNNYPATASPLNTGTVVDGINSYSYMGGPMLFQIVDQQIKSPSGYNLATIGNSAMWRGAEYATAKVKNDCETFVTFFIERGVVPLFTTESLCYSKYSRNPVTGAINMIIQGQVLKSDNIDPVGGIVLTKERADGSRFLYYASTETGQGFLRRYTLNADGTINGETVLYTTNTPFLMAELELSHDGTRLAFSRVRVGSWSPNAVDNDVVIFEIDPSTGDLANSTPHYINLATNDDFDHYPGIEFSADGSELFVFRAGVGLYKINMTNYSSSQINGFDASFTYSMLELGRDGYYYFARDDGLYRMDDAYAISPFASGPMATNAMLAYFGCTVYVLPDQIDGQDYKTHTNSIACCYVQNESPIKNPNMSGVVHNSSTGDITITGSDVQWTQTSNPFTSGGQAITDVYLKGKISINKGAKLTITGLTLHFKENEIIQMSYNANGIGSRLFLYNSKLTAFDECESSKMWGGIRCSGNSSQPQGLYGSSKQPYTYMSNSTIEFATIGVTANTGGIVRAFNSNFKDNIRDVRFLVFTVNNNISEFATCNFYTTEALYAKGASPVCHAEILVAPGVLFEACNFSNDYATSVPLAQRGDGIVASSSSITVNEKCTTPIMFGEACPDPHTVRGSFSNLRYGIKTNMGDYITISRQNFNNCVGGAWLNACNAIKVTENDFDVYNYNPNTSLQYETFGLYVANSTGYKIEGNNFHDGLLGLVVYASGEAENLVYRNNFENLSGNGQASSFVGIGVNYDYANKLGLQLLCNNFIDVDYAMTVLGGDIYGPSGQIISVSQSDIRSTQGMEAYGYGQFSTHNYFEGIPLNQDRFFVVDPNVSAISTYAYNQENVNGYKLGTYSSNIYVVNRSAPTCEQTIYPGPPVIIGPLMQSIGGLNDEQTELENQLNSLTSYNDLYLTISAQSANYNNNAEVYSQLSSASPYLISEILLAYLDNPNVPELSKVSLMLENSPLPSDVIEAIENSNLSAEYIDHILQYQEGVNEIEVLQNKIIGLKAARQIKYDNLIRETFNADTSATFAETYNSVMEFMETQNDYHAKNRLVDMYIHSQMWDEALNLLSTMRNSLSADYVAEANDIRLTEIKIDILRNSNTEAIADVVNKYKDFLNELAADYNTKEGGVARAILESAGFMENIPIIFLPNLDANSQVSNKSTRISKPIQEPVKPSKELVAMFNLYPNPANDYLSLEFINPVGNCNFNIYTLKGELVKSVRSKQTLGFISINISDLKQGNYIISCPELNSNQSFIITR